MGQVCVQFLLQMQFACKMTPQHKYDLVMSSILAIPLNTPYIY